MSRESFEAWFGASKYVQVVYPTEGDIQRAWDAWQASRKAALLEAADKLSGFSEQVLRRMAEGE